MVIQEGSRELWPISRRVLKGGGVAILPCDTMYGIVGMVPGTDDRIRRIKGRGEEKPFLQLLADASWVKRLSEVKIPKALEAYWPGPLTLIIPLTSGGTVGVRVPASTFLTDLIRTIDVPLFSTSVNRAGSPPLWKIAEIIEQFESEVDMVVDGGDLPHSTPSTIVDVTSRPYRVLRQGELHIPAKDLL